MDGAYPPSFLGHGSFAPQPAIGMDEKDPTTAGNLLFAGIPDGPLDEKEEGLKEENEEVTIKKQ